ncbi:DUF2382 domain-containing protein [Geodermatophilus sp. SYSU D00708]
MIGTDAISRVIGKDVYDESGDKIGSASEVYLDDETGQPEWVTVRTGLFGTKETFVPIRQADLTDDGLRVPVSKSAVKDAPKIDTEGHLSPQEEQELYRYYGMDFGSGNVGRTDTTVGRVDQAGTAGTRTGTESTTGMATTGMAGQGIADRDLTDRDRGAVTDRDRDLTGADAGTGRHTDTRAAVGHDTSGPTTDNAMTRSEEQLNVGTRSEEVGRARLRKYVVTENQTETVPVSREEVRVEREPITDANVGNALDGPAISEEEHEVTLHAERPVVEKEAVPVERVRLDKETVTDTETVSADVRKEQIDFDDAQGTGRRGDALDRDRDGRIG